MCRGVEKSEATPEATLGFRTHTKIPCLERQGQQQKYVNRNLVLDYLHFQVESLGQNHAPGRSNLLIGPMHGKDVGQDRVNEVAALDGTLLLNVGVMDGIVAVDDVVLHFLRHCRWDNRD